MKQTELVKLKDITQSGFFRKVNGTYVYKIISPASSEFLKLDSNFIHGVTFNGNTASVDKDKVVTECNASDFISQYIVINPDYYEIGCNNLVSRI